LIRFNAVSAPLPDILYEVRQPEATERMGTATLYCPYFVLDVEVVVTALPNRVYLQRGSDQCELAVTVPSSATAGVAQNTAARTAMPENSRMRVSMIASLN
jgi:hypothetical protein